MMTWSCSSLVSSSWGCMALTSWRSRVAPILAPRAARYGVSAIDNATTRYNWLVRAAGSTPLCTASPKATKANSPPGARSKPERMDASLGTPNRGPAPAMTATLPTISTTIAAMTSFHFCRNSCAEISMPTLMKNRPSSRPLYGAMSLSTCSANSVSAMSRPARKAPSASDRPAKLVSTLVPSTTSNVVAAKISAFAKDDICL
mmetsp:Transcript_14986/g.39669  ORF Transcript_14986/g.39669 Transcript_14986/m.39669 type:complete len:203 (+) Transcript_14986:1351-1959(+)